ncbi:hypothetical protein B0H16DRAFT_1609890 [Mycena metata]|uniref:Uncharacterized protein n=1 Tax=Mycena metata TaxID=1033252 RepID=A0AAD7MHM0_9AGAR|nr:hypothetical protein B0H16DRAFT_1609890 [Mycena metata]
MGMAVLWQAATVSSSGTRAVWANTSSRPLFSFHSFYNWFSRGAGNCCRKRGHRGGGCAHPLGFMDSTRFAG